MKLLWMVFMIFLWVPGIAKPVSIAVSIFPVADIVAQVAGTEGKIETVIPPFANPHHFSPTPSTSIKLQDADVFFAVTPEFDGWIRKFLPETTKVIFLKGPDQPNEHIWLYPEGGRRIAGNVAKTLSELFPGKAGIFQKNLTRFLSSMDQTDKELATILAGAHGTTFIQYHPAWDNFAARYGLKILATISSGHGKELSPRELLVLIKKARASHVRVVVMGLHKKSRTTETLIREIYGMELRLDALGNPENPERNSYQKLLLFNGRKLAGVLHE